MAPGPVGALPEGTREFAAVAPAHRLCRKINHHVLRQFDEPKRKGASAPSRNRSALGRSGRQGAKALHSFGLDLLLRIALSNESGQLRFERPALIPRKETPCQFATQFVDVIDCKHVRLRLDDVDTRRAPEDRGGDRGATGGAGEWGSRFCRLFDEIGGTVRPCGGPSSRMMRRNRERRIADPKGTRPYAFLPCPNGPAARSYGNPLDERPTSSIGNSRSPMVSGVRVCDQPQSARV